MKRDEAMQLALGYTWGCEDTSGTKTFEPNGKIHAFAYAFTDAWQLYNLEKLTHMMPVQDAYKTWQATNGETIWRKQRDRDKHDRALAAMNERTPLT